MSAGLPERIAIVPTRTRRASIAGSFDRRLVRAGMPPLKRQPLTCIYNRFAPLLRLYIDLASGIPIASQFGPKWLRVQISDFPALSARSRIGISKPTEDDGMSAGEVKQYLVEHAKSHGAFLPKESRSARANAFACSRALSLSSCSGRRGGGGGLVHRPNRRTQTACHPKSEPRNFRRSGRGGKLLQVAAVRPASLFTAS
jgi:hypothetical protein